MASFTVRHMGSVAAEIGRKARLTDDEFAPFENVRDKAPVQAEADRWNKGIGVRDQACRDESSQQQGQPPWAATNSASSAAARCIAGRTFTRST